MPATSELSATTVVKNLVRLAQELDTTVRMLKEADEDAVLKRHHADLVESRAFVSESGAMELRKHQARIAADKQESEALVAEALVRHLRMNIRALETRIDVGRTAGASLRAEMAFIGASS